MAALLPLCSASTRRTRAGRRASISMPAPPTVDTTSGEGQRRIRPKLGLAGRVHRMVSRFEQGQAVPACRRMGGTAPDTLHRKGDAISAPTPPTTASSATQPSPKSFPEMSDEEQKQSTSNPAQLHEKGPSAPQQQASRIQPPAIVSYLNQACASPKAMAKLLVLSSSPWTTRTPVKQVLQGATERLASTPSNRKHGTPQPSVISSPISGLKSKAIGGDPHQRTGSLALLRLAR